MTNVRHVGQRNFKAGNFWTSIFVCVNLNSKIPNKKILNEIANLGCKILGDKNIMKNYSKPIKIANKKDWHTEYLAPTISVKCVNGVDE